MQLIIITMYFIWCFDLYRFIHAQLDPYPSNAHELSTVTVRK